ncbi:hypothetical protein PHYSODRAFT_301996 [Phytophthora sojae]|uniref:Ankyrin repeat protein n=1 Tax=Phytophthora sojae (strain P6497) TaxID=1094619 RepID=G4ZQG5_PHYSP|nr:hypothetical protein PHYSODRAFT_301996 [Phytophthora sojae]EGZ15493.1 hypothetical protein PHYSODRAFT_301996 [Phytophthora sojae]|eukprot:XP_009529242.1 hypothetical protein PHYSODRAFT_301996 [Phytophthora sojae]
MVKPFYNEDKLRADSLSDALVSAAARGHLEIVNLLQSKPDYNVDAMGLGKAFVKAARRSQLQVLELLYAIEGYQVSAEVLETAFLAAVNLGNLEVVKFLDSKIFVSPDFYVKAFLSAAVECNTTYVTVGNQVGVLQFLYAKGCVRPELISHIFPKAAACSSLEGVEFLYKKGCISPDLVDAAFEKAVLENSADVVEFLYKTGFVRTESVEGAFLIAAERGDVYILECLIECGCTCRAVLKESLKSCSSVMTRRLLLRAYKSLAP